VTRALGYRPDPPKRPGEKPDYDARTKLRAAPIPYRASNRHLVLSVLDQGMLGSCVANAVMQAVRASQVRQGAVNPPLGSRLWTYYLARKATNEENEDNGTYIRHAFAGIATLGFPPESAWPYSDQGRAFAQPPPAGVTWAAYDQRTPTEYHRIYATGAERVLEVKRALSQGFLVCFGSPVSVRFCNNDLGAGPVPPPINEPIAGGHAQTLVGYIGDEFDVVNSWGESWGDRGYWTMSAEYLAWEEVQDAWICEAAPPYSST
jgi:C1A family cysteine protease